jgi:PAS domain S-box-containing protein
MEHLFPHAEISHPKRYTLTPMVQYMIALAAVAAATIVRRLLDPVLGTGVPYAMYLAAVLFVASFTSMGPALLTLVLGAWAANFFFFEPRYEWMLHLHGATQWVSFSVYAILGISVILISETFHRAREFSEKQTETFRTTLISIGDAVIVTDAEARVRFMNDTAEKLTAWTSRDAGGVPLDEVFKIVNEETRKKVESPVEKSIRAGAIVGLANHTILIAKDGTEYHIDDSAAPIRNERGDIFGVVLVFRDIGSRREAEKNLAASEMRYRRLFEAAHDGILILDAGTMTVIDVNRFMLDLLREPREYFMGKALWELGLFPDSQKDQEAMRTVREEGTIRYESIMQDRDGRRVPVEFVNSRYQEGRKPVIQCNVRDMRERKRFESEREAHLINEQMLRMEAENANRAKDMFLATLSHEMRTPLNAIVGWMSILRRQGCNENELQQGLEVIDRNTKAQVQLIEDVLDVSRIVSGKLRLEIRSCDLVESIKAGVATVQPAAEAKEITIDMELDPLTSKTSCDAARIQQVVWNLVANAVKFTPRGGKVRVTLEREKSNLRLDVSDNGQGITQELLPYVFDRFRQADSSKRRKHGGLGLGLAIVKHLVEAHGGTVRVQSDGEGKGSTFTVLLPIRAVRIEEDRGDSPGSAKEGNIDMASGGADSERFPLVRLDGTRVLVVDDEADARQLLVKVLQQAGATVLAADSAREALEILSKLQPEVLVSDLGMPDEDGFDLIRAVRGRGLHPRDLPAVALTAFVSKEDQRQALLAGFQVHVPKPVDPHDLTAVIASLTGRTGK